ALPTAPVTSAPPAVAVAGATSRASSPPRGAAIPTRCPRCTKPADKGLSFCGYCGTRIAPAGAGTCAQCGANFLQGVDLFCARCGNRVGQRVSVEIVRASPPADAAVSSPTQGVTATRRDGQPRLALLDDEANVARVYVLE